MTVKQQLMEKKEREIQRLIEIKTKETPHYLSLSTQDLLFQSDRYNDGMSDLRRDCFYEIGWLFMKYLEVNNSEFSISWIFLSPPKIFLNFILGILTVEGTSYIFQSDSPLIAIEIEIEFVWRYIYSFEDERPGYFKN
jgi:hypothetical protein